MTSAYVASSHIFKLGTLVIFFVYPPHHTSVAKGFLLLLSLYLLLFVCEAAQGQSGSCPQTWFLDDPSGILDPRR